VAAGALAAAGARGGSAAWARGDEALLAAGPAGAAADDRGLVDARWSVPWAPAWAASSAPMPSATALRGHETG